MQETLNFFSKHVVLCSIWCILLTLIISNFFNSITSKIKFISCSEATQMINNQEALVIDLRSREKFREGHIAGSLNMSMKGIQLDNRLKNYKNRQMIIISDSKYCSREHISIFYSCGFKKLFMLEEGIESWKREKLPLVFNE